MLQSYKTTLEDKTQLTSDVFLFRFRLIDPVEISFTAGQYLILMVPQEGKEPARRLYSIASPPTEKASFEFLVKLIPGGVASEFLKAAAVGSEATFQGPAGMFTLRESPRNKIFLATGTGIAPMRSMLQSMLNPKQIQNPNDPNAKQINFTSLNFEFRVFLLWGLKKYIDVYFLEELKQFSMFQVPNSTFQFLVCLSREITLDVIPEPDREYFTLGRITKGLDLLTTNHQSPITNFDFYICGSREMVDTTVEDLLQRGVPQPQIVFEKF